MKILKIEKAVKEQSPWTRTLKMQRVMDSDILNYGSSDVIAMDPGVNFGLTIMTAGGIWMYHGSLLKDDSSLAYAWSAFNFVKDVLFPVTEPVRFVLEGAAYHKIFGQVGLADVRTGFYLGARMVLPKEAIMIVAPMAARKAVLGDGKSKPWELFPTSNHNAIDSLVLAAYAMGTQLRV